MAINCIMAKGIFEKKSIQFFLEKQLVFIKNRLINGENCTIFNKTDRFLFS
jgi:hypothetical protein